MKWGVTMEKAITNNQIVKVLRVGPFIVDDKHDVNVYFLSKGAYSFLIDLPPIQKFEQMRKTLENQFTIEELSYIIILNGTLSTIEVLANMMDEGFHGTIITSEYLARQLRNAELDLKIIKIEEGLSDHILDGLGLSFIPMFFLPYPDMFAVYEPYHQILFSNLLFSSYSTKKNPQMVDLQKQMFSFHKEMMPSSIFLLPMIKKMKTLSLKHIFPSYGEPISSEQIPVILDYMSNMSFHNNYLINSKTGFASEDIDYIEIINQLLIKLKNHFSRIEILNTFVGSPFHLDQETLMLNKTSLVNYKMWHSFFDYVFAKKGMPWLTMMEPVMKHMMDTFQLELPSIYRSETIKLRQEALSLEEKKIVLETTLSELQQQINDAKDQILRDKLTKLYAQDVLIRMMMDHFSKPLSTQEQTRGLLLIQLDQLPDINRRFNKETGDETVRNMAYVLEQEKGEHTLLFKQSGPGIYAMIEAEHPQNIEKEAIKFRNAIASSTTFIEKVTVSIAMVTCHEVDQSLAMEEKLAFLMSTVEKRMAFAKIKGQNLIIDEKTELPELIEGSLLLVDQDEINRNMLFRIFKRAHYEIVLADSVIEAFTILQKQKIDLVISEINLSKMDGFQLKMMMNESKAFQDVPFIMVSHNKTIENIKRGNLLGVDLILEKPIIPEELIGHVNRMKERVKV